MGSTDLSLADLRGAVIAGTRLWRTNLSGADLSGVDLTTTDTKRIFEPNLSGANLHNSALNEEFLSACTLTGVNLSGQNLNGYRLSSFKLKGVDLRGANLQGANLSKTDLNLANLSNANLSCANLQSATLDRSDLTGANFWETLRAGWSIKGVTCEHAFWDRAGKNATLYTPGEFERLYSDQTTIELFYEGGISSFELNTLPALLQHLASKHPDASIHLRTVEQTGGGAKITINLGDADDSLKEEIEADARQVVTAQLQLRDNHVLRLQIENATLRQMHESAIRLMLASSAPQITFNAPVHTAAIPSGNAKIELHQTFNDNTALIQLIDNLLTPNTELTAVQSSEVKEAKAELQKPEPQKTRLSRFYDFLKTLPQEAILKGAGKLGEKAAEADWSSLLHQLSELIHHLH